MPLFNKKRKDPINKPRAIENGPLSELKAFELLEVESAKIPVYSIIQNITGLSFDDAKRLVENVPSTIPVNNPREVEMNIEKLIKKGCKIKR